MKVTGFKLYHGEVSKKELLFVKVETDEGIFGLGEATLREKVLPVVGCIKILEKKIVGSSIFDMEKIFFELFFHDRWRNGVIMNTALSGIEMAMLDAMGKKLGQPVYNLLGGKVRDNILLYVNGWQDLDEKSAPENAKRMADLGYKAMKWNPIQEQDIFSASFQLESKKFIDMAIDEVGAVRQAVGKDVELFIECHGRLDYDNSLRLAKGIEQFDPGFLEEPMQPDNIQGFRRLERKINIPLAAGERQFTRWGHLKTYQEGILSIAQPDFTHCGGLWEAKKMSNLAETFYIKIAPHNSSGPVATMASAQVDMTLPNFFMQEFVYKKNIEANERFFTKGLNMKDGFLIMDDSPGLGITPDFDALEEGQLLK